MNLKKTQRCGGTKRMYRQLQIQVQIVCVLDCVFCCCLMHVLYYAVCLRSCAVVLLLLMCVYGVVLFSTWCVCPCSLLFSFVCVLFFLYFHPGSLTCSPDLILFGQMTRIGTYMQAFFFFLPSRVFRLFLFPSYPGKSQA